jgi:magnesium-transporting ATPase (P-type)
VNLFLLTHWLAASYPELEFNDSFFETGDGGRMKATTGSSKTSKNKNNNNNNKNNNKNKDRQNRAKFILSTHNDYSLNPLSASEVGEIVKKTVENNLPVETPEHVRQIIIRNVRENDLLLFFFVKMKNKKEDRGSLCP